MLQELPHTEHNHLTTDPTSKSTITVPTGSRQCGFLPRRTASVQDDRQHPRGPRTHVPLDTRNSSFNSIRVCTIRNMISEEVGYDIMARNWP